MKKFLFTIVLLSLSANITYLFADNDTIVYSEYYSCDFESSSENNQWQSKNSSGANKWTINSYDGSNTCLYVSNDASDTVYSKKSSSISVKYRNLTLSADDSLLIECDVNIGGEGGNDYMKIMIVPNDFDLTLPSPTSSSLGFVDKYYKTYSFIFEDSKAYISETKGEKHIIAKTKNPAVCSGAKLMFIWRNDNSGGDMPGAIVDNISLKGIPTVLQKSVCQGEEISFAGKQISQEGLYCDTLQTDGGCDSVVYLQLAVNPVLYTEKDTVICSNIAFTLSNGNAYYEEGTYIDTLISQYGCDSIVTYNLTMKPAHIASEADALTYEICEGDVFTTANKEFTQSGYYSETLVNSFGCDSVVNFYLLVNPVYKIDTVITVKTGENYDFNGVILTKTGVYYDTLQTEKGCDSMITLHLQVKNSFDDAELSCFQLYPNPSAGVITLDLGYWTLNGKEMLYIIDNKGQIVYKSAVDSVKTNLDVSMLKSGAYILQIRNGKNTFEKTLIIQ